MNLRRVRLSEKLCNLHVPREFGALRGSVLYGGRGSTRTLSKPKVFHKVILLLAESLCTLPPPAFGMDFLKSAVASAISKGPPFPYSFGDRQDIDQSIWTLYNGTRRV